MTEQLEMYEYWEPEDKPKGVMQMVKQFVKTSGQTPSLGMSAGLICEEYIEWEFEQEHYGTTNAASELKELADLVYVVYGYANARGWDLDEALFRVHENNMGRMYQPDGTIQRREDGKILRNKDYPKPDLSDLV